MWTADPVQIQFALFFTTTSTKLDTLMVLVRQHVEVVCRLDEGALLLLLSCLLQTNKARVTLL
jgi:hypothetical protein